MQEKSAYNIIHTSYLLHYSTTVNCSSSGLLHLPIADGLTLTHSLMFPIDVPFIDGATLASGRPFEKTEFHTVSVHW